MGLYDRDYMRDPHREKKSAKSSQGHSDLSIWARVRFSAWLLWRRLTGRINR